jgi:hypothetical protein
MPTLFEFYIDGNTHWRGILSAERCRANTKTHVRCYRQTLFGLGWCYQHLMKLEHLRVKESSINNSGKGVFACDPSKPEGEPVFRGNQLICTYNGEIIDHDELEERYDVKTGPYVVELDRNEYEDGALQRGLGSCINHVTDNRVNAQLVLRRNNRVSIIATRIIRNGDEIFVNYGRAYRFGHEEGSDYKTKRISNAQANRI